MTTIRTFAALSLLVCIMPVCCVASEATQANVSFKDAGMADWLIQQGVSHYEAGKYDESIRLFNAALTIDKYNAEALKYKKRAVKKILVFNVRLYLPIFCKN